MLKSIAAKVVRHTAVTAVIVSGILIGGATQPVVQLDNPEGVIECWNPHTAQITVVDGDTCPVAENPYK